MEDVDGEVGGAGGEAPDLVVEVAGGLRAGGGEGGGVSGDGEGWRRGLGGRREDGMVGWAYVPAFLPFWQAGALLRGDREEVVLEGMELMVVAQLEVGSWVRATRIGSVKGSMFRAAS